MYAFIREPRRLLDKYQCRFLSQIICQNPRSCQFCTKEIIMEKNITASYGGANSTVGDLLVNRLLPNRYVQAVGPFVFLDHVYPVEQNPRAVKPPTGDFAHPHRGMATLSYVLSGGLEHFDSRGHHGIVSAGGMQWMKAGNG